MKYRRRGKARASATADITVYVCVCVCVIVPHSVFSLVMNTWKAAMGLWSPRVYKFGADFNELSLSSSTPLSFSFLALLLMATLLLFKPPADRPF